MLATGVDPDHEFAVKGPFLAMLSGDVLASDAKEAEVMLGEGLAKSLKAKPGTGLTLLASTTDGALNALDVTVKGVFSTGVPDIDKRLVYTDIATAQKLLNTKRVSTLGVFLKSMEATAGARERVAAANPKLVVQTWLDQAFFYHSVRGLYNRIFGALGLIIGLIVVFVVANAMAMAIIERTREIGTLRALGTLPMQLLRTLALEGMVLGGVGAFVGALLALAVSLLLYAFPVQMPPPPGSSRGYALVTAIDAPIYLMTVLAMVAVSMLASAWIARKTVHIPVVEALAHT
jgi:putative ABC transport system permease protein